MILPDTNVISEAMREGGNPWVLAWLNDQPEATLRLASPVLAELLLGVALLPQGARQARLASTMNFIIQRRFTAGVEPFDLSAARQYAQIVATARKRGVAISVIDGQVAAMASALRATVATRDTAPFLAAGVPVFDPWLYRS